MQSNDDKAIATAVAEIVDQLRGMESTENRAGMARYGITVDRAFGVSIAQLRPLAKQAGRHQDLADGLWATGFHEARLLACYVAEPKTVTRETLDAWVTDLDSWDLCDQFCNKLVVFTPHAHTVVDPWARDERPFVRRAGFSLIAQLAYKDKALPEDAFSPYLALIDTYAEDERNFVKKAVNWALRQIGKRTPGLNAQALALAEDLVTRPSKSARWIGRDARKELESEKVRERLGL